RSEEGISFDNLVLSNDRMSAEVNGAFAEPNLDLTVGADVADLSLVTERAAGRAHVAAKLAGTTVAPRIEAEATGEEVVLMGIPLADARARFSGVVAGPETAGDAELSGTLGGAPVVGAARLSAAEGGARRLEGLSFAVGESRMSGDLMIGADGFLSGNVAVVSPDLSKVAPLFLVEASGMLRGEVALAVENGEQSAHFAATATDLVYENVALDTAEIDGRARDLFGAPQLEGNFALRNLRAGGLAIVSATGTAERRGAATAIAAEAELADGRAALVASLEPRGEGFAVGMSRFSFTRGGIDLALASPTAIVVADGTAAFNNARLNAGGGAAAISGRAGETLDLTVELAGVPAALANTFSPGLGAEGTVAGTVTLSGAASDPRAHFELSVASASVLASRNTGLGPLNVSAEGDLAEKRVTLAGRIAGADGLAVNVNGAVGTAEGAPLDLTIAGSVPLSLGNRELAARGAALRGALDVDIKVSGTAAAPQFAGRAASEGGGFVDPQSGIVLSNLSLAASVSNNRLVIDRLNARSGEGNVAAEGSLGLDPNAGLPVDMRVNVRGARYVDGTLIAATFDAELTLSGSLTGSPTLQGSVTLKRTEITVPERLPGDSVAVAVEHVVPPPPVERTLAIVRERENGRAEGGGGPSGITLDVAVSAPRQIFVRGRGLDAELGGDLRLIGPVSSVGASGSFELIRGRLDILTQRITLDRGILTFTGDLDPILDFIGTTRSGDVTVTVAISGRASDPEITFTSVPDLPQDEILAQLIFGKGIGELSPLQIARLGAAASELAGGGGGALSRLRASTGLDDLDIVVDEEGQAALAAGRYVSENVYVGVQQGTTAEKSRVTIDLDITKGVKARAGYSVEGESSLGIFFEKEY
ncbi:MAG: translocation/assembly module TamB domain-containing protein, partial [Propylenella sp.]